MATKQYTIPALLIFVLLSLSVSARECNDKVYLINFAYDENSKLNFVSQYDTAGCYPSSEFLQPYLFEIRKEGDVYYSTSFDYKVIYTDVLDGDVVLSGIKKAYKTRFTLVVPYREDIDGFVVREKESVVLSVDGATFYSKANKEGEKSQGLFDWVEGLLKGLLGSIFS